MKVLVATGLYPPEIGGPATHTIMMEEYLPQLEIEICTVSFSEVRRLPKVIRHFFYFLKCVKNGKDVDIIFAQEAVSVGFPAMCAAKLLRKKFVVRMSGDYAWEQSVQRFGVTDTIDEFQHNTYGFRAELFRAIRTFVSRRTDLIITPSSYFNALVCGWGIDEKKVITVYNGIDLSIRAVRPSNVPNGKIIVSAGRLVSWKGFTLLMDVIEELPSNWSLVIIGDGIDEVSLKEYAHKNNNADRIVFTGRLSREEVYGWCKEANVFALNTSFESFSFQIVEAMASGVPVVTTNIGSIPELITSGIEGVLLAPDDYEGFKTAIKNIPREEVIWDDRTRRAVAKSKEFSVEETARKLAKVLQALLD